MRRSLSALGQTVAHDQTATRFPSSFFWGAATSALQVEGVPSADGGGESIWDVYLRTPNATKDGSNNLVACDEYHRWRDDLKLMQQIGLNAYRFSISWSRVLPDGKGRVNARGFDYYDQLVDALVGARITPFITVYHGEYPEALQKQGGWVNPDSPAWFADYSHLLSSRLSDRVDHWLTHNEPNLTWAFGADLGFTPPNQKLSGFDLVRGANNILLGHGMAVQALCVAAKRPIQVGLPLARFFSIPASNDQTDIDAARKASFEVKKQGLIPGIPGSAMLSNSWWLDLIFLGKYPEDGMHLYPEAAQVIRREDLETISQPLDFCGVNLYAGVTVKAGADGSAMPAPPSSGTKMTHSGWPETPDILSWGPKFLFERYKKPVVITENGVSCDDKPTADGKVHDSERSAYLDVYLKSLSRALRDGVPVNGYFYWSLLDNFKWKEEYGQRFGLIYVDFTTQKRILKDSATRYREIIRSHGEVL